MDINSKIYIAGHNGMVGSAIVRELKCQSYSNIITKNRNDLDLLNQEQVRQFFEQERPEYVFLAAAKVGGIHANNSQPAEFIYQNLQIQNNIIHNSYLNKVKKLIFLGSSCIYPKLSQQPIKEEYLLTGELEKTNYAYAIAKIAGIKMCQAYNQQYGCNFISAMPTNLYGINDNFDLETSHVLPALLRKFHEAKLANDKFVEVWGSGTPKREFLYVDDLAKACIFLMSCKKSDAIVNIGTGNDQTIYELAQLIKEITGFKGNIKFNPEKPDGTPRKVLDVSKINKLGWKSQTQLTEGIRKVYEWYIKSAL